MEDFEIWVEKYRPRTLDEVVGQDEVIQRLKGYAERKNIPHLLFSGPPGTGKTATSIALARDLFGENWRDNFIEMNASDERGIDVIRGKVKDFARTVAIDSSKKVEFKIIFLDEADALTSEAQQALRRTMEVYSRETRFILSCNYSSKIIEPIQSRTAVFRFLPLQKEDVELLIRNVAKKESLLIDDEGIEALFYVSEGDMRKVLNTLQGASYLTKKLTADIVYKTTSRARPKEIQEMLNYALSGNFKKARKMLEKLTIHYGLSGEDIILQIFKEVQNLDIDERKKIWLIDKIGEYNFRLVEGANEKIQIEALLSQFLLVGNRGNGKK